MDRNIVDVFVRLFRHIATSLSLIHISQAAFASLGEYHDIRPLFSEAAAVRFIIFIPEQGFVVEFRSDHNIYPVSYTHLCSTPQQGAA